MPTHEEHLAGIEEATGRVRTLKARFNSVENDWCEAAKQLQRVHDIRQKWIDEHGSAPSDPVIQPLLQPCQKLYIRKAREYLAVSREMTALITQRDMRIWRYLAFVNTESSTEERDEYGAHAERERAAYRERMRQQRSARAEAEDRQRREEEAQRQKQEEEEAQRQKQEQEEAQRQRQEQEEAQRQERARAKARARERRDAEQRQERARQEQARRQAEARQEEQTRRQRAQAQQDSRKRQREQAEQEARQQQQQQQQEARKRQKTQPHSQSPEHNTTAPTIPYGNLNIAQATLEWRTRFLETWPAPFYRTLQAFPAPPPIPCSASPCCTRTGTERILKVCDKFLRETFKTLSKDELRVQRIKWHPDRFSACPGPYREAYKGMAGEVFVVVNEIYEKKMVGASGG